METRQCKKVLNDRKCCEALEELQRRLVIVPIDKASNNIGLVCKPYMIGNIIKEVTSETYKKTGNVKTGIANQIKLCRKKS